MGQDGLLGLGIPHNILGLDVPVENASGVERYQGTPDLTHDLDRVRFGEGTIGLQSLSQGDTAWRGHNNIRAIVDREGIEDLGQMGMGNLGEVLGCGQKLLLEPGTFILRPVRG